MFQRHDYGLAHGGGAAAAPLPAALPLDLPFPADPGGRLAQAIADIDWTPDLGARIGTREWWRGVATCLALCAGATALVPSPFATLPGIAPPAVDAEAWRDGAGLGVVPLAYGGDSGTRAAPTDAVRTLATTPERPQISLTATLGQGDGFARVLERSGVSRDEARQVSDLIAPVVPLADIAPGTRIALTLGRRARRSDPRPVDALAFRARFDLALAVERVGGRLTIVRTPIAVDDTPLRIRGRVGDSLYRAARAAGAPAKAIEAYLRTLAPHVPVGSIGGDERFDIVVAHERAATGETRVGQLLYAGLDRGRRQVRLLRWEQGGRSQFFEASGVGEQRGVLARPVDYSRVSSNFGLRRHPVLGYSRMHKGMDFAAPYGAVIRAATDGTVAFAGWHGGHGKYVRLAHGGGIATGYAHMSRISVASGQRVTRGQVIGHVGSTGMSTGPHLHYELYKGGQAVNPRSVTFTTTAQLAGAELRAFRAKLARLTAL